MLLLHTLMAYLKIQLFDRGTPAGKKLFSQLEEICQRLQLDTSPDYITDMYKVIEQGIQANTVLMINYEPVLVDKFPGTSELEAIISEFV